MLAGGTDLLYRSILAGPHEVVTRIEVWDSSGRIDPYGDQGVPFSGGSVSATLTSRVARSLAITVDRGLFPKDPSGLLAPFGNYLKVYSGVRNPGGPDYVWPVFVGRLNDITLDSTGSVSVTAIDRAGDLQDCYFTVPYPSDPMQSIGNQFMTLVEDALPNATFGAFDPGAYLPTPVLTWTADRASACDDLANAGNMFWYPLADGSFVMRTVAWTVAQQPVWTYTSTVGGTLLSWSVNYSRTNVFNQVTVVGERADGTTPVYDTEQDTDPTSPTYINGDFGVKGQYYNVQTVQTAGQARTLGKAYLAQARALTEQWSAQIIPDAALELGDALLVDTGTRLSSTQVVSGFTLSLDSADTMSVSLVAQQPGPLNFAATG